MDVAEAAGAAFGDQRARAVAVEIGDRLAARQVADDGADRHAQDEVFAAAAVAVRAHAVLAALGAEDAGVAEVDQRVEVAVGDGPDAAAAAAVAARGPTLRHVLLAPEGGRAIAAVAGDDLNLGFVEEFHERGAALNTEDTETQRTQRKPDCKNEFISVPSAPL